MPKVNLSAILKALSLPEDAEEAAIVAAIEKLAKVDPSHVEAIAKENETLQATIADLQKQRDIAFRRVAELSPREALASDPYKGPSILTRAEHAALPPHHQAAFAALNGTITNNPPPKAESQ